MKILNYDNNIYKKLKNIYDKTDEKNIAIISNNILIEKNFIDRFIVNKWSTYLNMYYIIGEISNNSIKNLIQLSDILQGIILNLTDDYPLDYINSIINYAIENKINIYLCNFLSNNQEKNEFVHFIGGINEI